MAYDNQQAYYQSLISAGNDPNASAEAKGNAAWAQAQSDYNPNYSGGSSPPPVSTSSYTSTPSYKSSSSPSNASSNASSNSSSPVMSPASVSSNSYTPSSSSSGSSSNSSSSSSSTPPSSLGSQYKQDSNGYWTTNPSNPNAERFDSNGNPMASVGYNGQSGLVSHDQFMQYNALNGNPQAQQQMFNSWVQSGQLKEPTTQTTPDMSGYNTTNSSSGSGGSGSGSGSGSGGGGYGYDPSGAGQQAAYQLFGADYTPSSTNSQYFDPAAAQQAALGALTGTAANGQPSYSQQLMDSYNKLVNSLDPTSSYWDAYHNTANTLGQTIYNTQKQGYQNTINQLNEAKQNELNTGQNALTNKSFQDYLNTRQGMSNRGQLDSGLNADANFRLQLANAQNLQNLYSRADATYDPRIADANAKMNILSPDQIAAQQFQNMFNSASKNNATALRNSAQTLGKVMPYDFTTQADQLKNAQAYDKMGMQNSNFLDSLQQKYAALNQKSQSDAVNQLMGYDKNTQNNQTKTGIAAGNNQTSLYNNWLNNQTKSNIASDKNQLDWSKWVNPSGNTTQNNLEKEWQWQNPNGNTVLNNNTKQLIANYPYLYQTMNNKADNATKQSIADQLAQNNWNISKLNNDTKWQIAKMTNAFDYDKLGAQVKQWANDNQLKSRDLDIQKGGLDAKVNYDNAMIDKASQAASDGQTKTKLESERAVLNSIGSTIRAKVSANMGKPLDANDPDVQLYNQMLNTITGTLQGLDKIGSGGGPSYGNEYGGGISGGMPPQ